ncbi:MAG: hydroxyacid dehydrogenase [Anaerolineae bacterium]|nr:hydroxyacid dehydrogenase [Anaerolineae bacterium]
MPHVLIPDNVHQKAIDMVTNANGLIVSAPGKLSQADLIAQVGAANALIIRSGVKITPDVFAAAPNLSIVARAGVGVDNIDLESATEHGVVVVNTPGGNTISTAEHTFGLMLALARHIPQGHASLKAGRWDRKLFSGVELRGKTLGLVGFGRIGKAVAVRAKAFDMTVIAYDPEDSAFDDFDIERVDLDTLYAEADFISLHAPIIDSTHGMINAESLAKMKDGVRIVNAARGGLINDADLAEGIQSGKVIGAALDVFDPEPPADDNPLINLEGVIHTPHLAASTSDAQITVAVEAAQLIIDALLHGSFENVVNPAVLETIG